MAAATVSLSSTTFSVTVEPGDNLVYLASTSGLAPGVRLYAGRELIGIERFTGIGTECVVRRGLDGTGASRHATNETVWIGRADQFYSYDPVGLPPAVLLVYPYINILTGVAWVAQGDETGPNNAGRVWAPMTLAMSAGALGNQQVVVSVPLS